MNQEKIEIIKLEHTKWLNNQGGSCADFSFKSLSNINLSSSNFSGANFHNAIINHVNFSNSYLSNANFKGTTFYKSDLSSVKFTSSNLQSAKFYEVDLYDTSFYNANLENTDLHLVKIYNTSFIGSDITNIKNFIPSQMLLANWGYLTPSLCALAMAYDASAHHDPSQFDRWANGGPCPYRNTNYQRICIFNENRKYWDPNVKVPRTWDLMVALIKEKCANSDWHDKK